ncbi:MAG: alpha/beta hydrolase family protein, partial [Candidatus Dormibacteraceae bacterium]
NTELHVLDGTHSRRLAADHDLNITNTCYGDYQDADAGWPPPVMWLDEKNIIGVVTRRGSSLPYRFGLDGSVEALAEGDFICNYIASGGGRIAAVASTDGPSEVYAVEKGAMRRLTTDGSKWFGPFRRRVERLRIPHEDGHDIDAWLMTARGSRERGPMVITVHGGPHLSYGPTPWLEMNALADGGFHVLWSNPRGSTGYGEAFARSIDGQWGNKDASDVLRLAAWAIDEELAEPERIGIMGLSYGGFMTNWLLGRHPGVFAAAASENPATDMIAMYATSDFGRIIGPAAVGVEDLSDHLTEFLDRSPYTKIHRNHAPLLLLQAESDLRCPAVNSDIVFTILRSLGRKVEMVRYPGESHIMLMIGRPDRRVDRLERLVGWFQEHLATRK